MADVNGKKLEDLSDDELLALSPEEVEALTAGDAGNTGDAGTGESPEGDAAAADQDPAPEDRETTEESTPDAKETGDADAAETKDDAATDAEAGQPGAAKKDEGKAKPDTKEAKESQAAEPAADQAVDYKAQFERLTKPFKANGRDFQVKDADEAIQLMQMGANYNKKMAALKPNLALMKMLEKANLLDADKISYLIDVHNKVPAAVNKLVKDSGIDPLDLSADKADGYTPGNHRVSDKEVELDQVIDELDSSPTLTRTLTIVSRDLDTNSKAEIAGNPRLIEWLDSHVQSGIYDKVIAQVDHERILGRLKGLSDLAAYQQVGDAMNARGEFAHLNGQAGQPANQGQQTAAAPRVVTPELKQADDSKRAEKKRAAAPAKAAASTAKRELDFNPLSLSDEEFAKFKPDFK